MRKKARKTIARLAVALMLAIAPAVALVAAPAPAANAYTNPANGQTYIQFRNHNATSKCMGVTGGNMNNGNSVVLWDCHSPQQSPDQWWTRQDTVQEQFGNASLTFQTFRNLVDFNKCLGVQGGVMTQGTPLVIWDCNVNHPDQKWDWVGAFFGGSSSPPNPIHNLQPFLNNGSFMSVAVKSAAVGNAATIVLWGYQGHPDQEWTEDDS